MLKMTAKETDVMTLEINSAAPNKPCRVIIKDNPAILKLTRDAPGVKTLNKAGIAINNENRGIKIHVLFKKKPKFIFEK